MTKENKKILIISNDKKLKDVLKFCFDGWGYDVFFIESPGADIAAIVKIMPDVVVIDLCAAAKTCLETCEMLKNDFATAYIPVITLINKRHLRQQLLALRQGVDDYLIKPPDPLDLRVRIEMALKRTQHSFYANPLTGLPGGIVIEETLKDRLKTDEPFVVAHIDIDNFKSFNDKYGYLKGDRIIMQTAYMLNTAIKNWGNKKDFIGHIGGDDYVMITTPNKYKEIAKNFICMFDTIAPFHYSDEDRQQGYLVAKDRTNTVRKIPLMSVTIALVIKNSTSEFTSIIELNERIAEVKQYLKKIPGSKYMADRRISNKDEHLTLQVFSNDDSVVNFYKPIGQILLEKNIVTIEQLDRALKIHWKRGTLLGEVMKDLGYITDAHLKEALTLQEDKLKAGL
ncbi:MAG TPA: diguanylate cyclase [Candidatus Omnitrophota bacterium]|nr:diguanylate cyclase [Candidatus Omnitrophota bacterium]HPS19635.1 diguanylate cyclase [Candidatus Omnitrophota bacterium]